MSHLIKVTNMNNAEIVDYFDGLAYKFLPDEPVNVPMEAIQHFFGMDFPADEATLNSAAFRDEAFKAVRTRWGWNQPGKETEARKIFNNIKFTPILIQQVELVANSDEPLPPREAKVPAKPSKFKPRADEGTEDEAEVS